MKRPPRPTLPAAVEAAYTLWLWLDARVTAWPTAVRHLSPDQHAFASQQLEPLGRALGGWIRALDRAPAP